MLVYQRVNSRKSHETIMFLWFSYGFPMVPIEHSIGFHKRWPWPKWRNVTLPSHTCVGELSEVHASLGEAVRHVVGWRWELPTKKVAISMVSTCMDVYIIICICIYIYGILWDSMGLYGIIHGFNTNLILLSKTEKNPVVVNFPGNCGESTIVKPGACLKSGKKTCWCWNPLVT